MFTRVTLHPTVGGMFLRQGLRAGARPACIPPSRGVAQYVGAIDQGTSSTRFIIFDKEGRVVSMKQKEHTQYFPAAGHVEHCPDEIWQNSLSVMEDALSASGLSATDIAGIGITNQRETTIAWNKETGEPYHNALVWNDIRTTDICHKLSDGNTDRFRAKTGLPISPYFSGSKMMYLLDKVDGLREAGEQGKALFGTVDSYLIWKLTNGQTHATDVTNASRTLLMDLHTLQWDDDILKAMNIPKQMLPAIHPSSGVLDTVCSSANTCLSGVPISGVLGDQQAALFGQACLEAGEVKATYGTGCFILLNTGERIVPSTNGLLTTVAYQLGDRKPVYALEGSVAYSGSTIQWLRDNLQIVSSANECEKVASEVEDNGGVYFVPAFSGLYAPHWRDDARGIIAGLTAYNTRQHIVRAALEATAFQAYEVIKAMYSDCVAKGLKEGKEEEGYIISLKVDGGASKNNLLMQFQSDLLKAPLHGPAVHETTALGAAFAAGLGVQLWTSEDDVRRLWTEDSTWTPQMHEDERAKYLSGWTKAVEKSLNWETEDGVK